MNWNKYADCLVRNMDVAPCFYMHSPKGGGQLNTTHEEFRYWVEHTLRSVTFRPYCEDVLRSRNSGKEDDFYTPASYHTIWFHLKRYESPFEMPCSRYCLVDDPGGPSENGRTIREVVCSLLQWYAAQDLEEVELVLDAVTRVTSWIESPIERGDPEVNVTTLEVYCFPADFLQVRTQTHFD